MIVSWRNIAASVGICTLLTGAGLVANSQTTPCCTPPASPPPPAPTCCQPPSNLIINVPGVNVAAPSISVGAVSSSVAVAGVSTTLSSGVVVSGSASGSGYVYGGGGGYSYAPPSQGSIKGLSVSGGYDTKVVEEDVSSTEEYCVDKITETKALRPVQAMCVDDRNVPHPASRMDEDLNVGKTFNGEVYRCLAGSHMQVTLGEMKDGKPSFAAGETFSCQKGEALWHAPGGKLSCKPQKAERNCNERSLLRKYGPGVKLIEVSQPMKICEPATRTKITKVKKEVQVPRPTATGDLDLTGGVGGY